MEEFYSKRHRLVREIDCELNQLQHVAEMADALSSQTEEDRKPWDAAAAAKYVADLFLGLENLCKRRYRYLDLAVPDGPDCHSDILKDFLCDSSLGGDLSQELAQRLKKYLRFRHRFSHGYGYEITWEIVEEPLRLLPETVPSGYHDDCVIALALANHRRWETENVGRMQRVLACGAHRSSVARRRARMLIG